MIVTIDKDLDQIPGLKYNFVKEIAYNITEDQADYNLAIQIMTGDSTDNIVGLPGIGAAKAAKAIHTCEKPDERMDEIVRMYQVHSGKEDWQTYLTEQAQLVYIRRQPDEMWEMPEVGEGEWGQEEVSMYGD